MGVRDGALPPAALDVLLPDSGDRRAVTPDQMMKGMAIMTEGTMISLRELFTIRQQVREAEATKTIPPTTTTADNAER